MKKQKMLKNAKRKAFYLGTDLETGLFVKCV